MYRSGGAPRNILRRRYVECEMDALAALTPGSTPHPVALQPFMMRGRSSLPTESGFKRLIYGCSSSQPCWFYSLKSRSSDLFTDADISRSPLTPEASNAARTPAFDKFASPSSPFAKHDRGGRQDGPRRRLADNPAPAPPPAPPHLGTPNRGQEWAVSSPFASTLARSIALGVSPTGVPTPEIPRWRTVEARPWG